MSSCRPARRARHAYAFFGGVARIMRVAARKDGQRQEVLYCIGQR